MLAEVNDSHFVCVFASLLSSFLLAAVSSYVSAAPQHYVTLCSSIVHKNFCLFMYSARDSSLIAIHVLSCAMVLVACDELEKLNWIRIILMLRVYSCMT